MWRITIVFLFALVIALPTQASPQKAHKQEKYSVTRTDEFQVRSGQSFSPAERNLIRSYLLNEQETAKSKAYRGLPPGLQKKVARGKSLPPGWQKNLAAGQSLDYQVYRQGISLPDILLQRLPPTPVGSEIIRVENEIIRLNSATRTILDVFSLIPTR